MGVVEQRGWKRCGGSRSNQYLEQARGALTHVGAEHDEEFHGDLPCPCGLRGCQVVEFQADVGAWRSENPPSLVKRTT